MSGFGDGVSAGYSMTHADELISGLISSAWNNWTYNRNSRTAVAAAKELLDYNSPSYQMKRLSEAGLNPNLVYGSGSTAQASTVPISAPGGSGYTTNDVVSKILQVKQMQQMDSAMNLQDAQAEKNRAEARFTIQQSDRYNEIIDTQIREANQRLVESVSRYDLNYSSVAYQAAKTNLAVAEEAYRRGEIGLQAFRKAEIIAQTNLFRSEEALNRTKDYYTDIEGQMSVLELEYKKLFYQGDRMKKLSDAEYEAATKKFDFEAKKAGATIGIEGNKAAQWSKWVFDRIGTLLGGAASGSAAAAIKFL